MSGATSPARRLRVAGGLTQQQLARRLGVSRPAVSQYESGGDTIGVDTLRRIAEACGVDVRLAFERPPPRPRRRPPPTPGDQTC